MYNELHVCAECGDNFRVIRQSRPTPGKPPPKWCSACRPKHTGFGANNTVIRRRKKPEDCSE